MNGGFDRDAIVMELRPVVVVAAGDRCDEFVDRAFDALIRERLEERLSRAGLVDATVVLQQAG